ncbi:MAG: hypothetical protein NC826_04920, partial [Candidatus Omnitrophica bacterium]|nr:hypothetical protein [Candidatus Omnitrophota bacterium]
TPKSQVKTEPKVNPKNIEPVENPIRPEGNLPGGYYPPGRYRVNNEEIPIFWATWTVDNNGNNEIELFPTADKLTKESGSVYLRYLGTEEYNDTLYDVYQISERHFISTTSGVGRVILLPANQRINKIGYSLGIIEPLTKTYSFESQDVLKTTSTCFILIFEKKEGVSDFSPTLQGTYYELKGVLTPGSILKIEEVVHYNMPAVISLRKTGASGRTKFLLSTDASVYKISWQTSMGKQEGYIIIDEKGNRVYGAKISGEFKLSLEKIKISKAFDYE